MALERPPGPVILIYLMWDNEPWLCVVPKGMSRGLEHSPRPGGVSPAAAFIWESSSQVQSRLRVGWPTAGCECQPLGSHL